MTSVRTTPARSAPRIGRTLLSRGDPDRDREPTEPSRVERDHPLAQGRTDELPIEVERRDEDLADRPGRVELALDILADRRGAPGRPADPEQRDVDAVPQLDDRAHARVRDERPLRGGVVDEPRRHQAARLAAERVGDPPVWLAFRAGRPVAAAQRDDRHRDGRRGLLERRGHRRDRGAIPHADGRPGPQRPAQDLGGEPADHPPGEVLGAGDRRREVDGIEAIASAKGVGGRALDRGPVDDPDLDDALGARPLEQARDLRPRDAELLGDRVLRLTQLVVEAAGPDELLEVAQRRPCTFVPDRCASMSAHHHGRRLDRVQRRVSSFPSDGAGPYRRAARTVTRPMGCRSAPRAQGRHGIRSGHPRGAMKPPVDDGPVGEAAK